MSGCLGCSCTHPRSGPTTGRLVVHTGVSHTRTVVGRVLAATGLPVRHRTGGLMELTCDDAGPVLSALRDALTNPEAAEVRAAVIDVHGDADADLAAAFAAPTLDRWGARLAHDDLRELISHEATAFRSVYQPIVRLQDGAERPVVAWEALLRATGEHGPVMPADLFAAAARADWLHVLDRVGRTTALRGASGWLGDDRLFINFVPTSIYRPEVCLRTTVRAAERAGLRLDQLTFEVTESEHVRDLDHLDRVFGYYREKGCQVALDDLGSGYSSLPVLVRLQPDVVKLDRGIVQSLPGPVATAVVTAVVDITHSYGGTVLAEGVETVEQAESARALGADLGQGWLFGRPEERAAAWTTPADGFLAA